MDKLWFDLETYSPINIKDGTYKYAEDVEIMLIAYAINDGPVQVYDITDHDIVPAQLVDSLKRACAGDMEIWAQNSMFDRTVMSTCYPDLTPSRQYWRDTMIQAYMCGLPGALDKMCEAIGVHEDLTKKEGRKLIMLFCVPQKTGPVARATRETHPEEWKAFIHYAAGDIEAMRECYNLMPLWNFKEPWLSQWHLDQLINDRGFAVDTELATSAIEAVKREQIKLSKKTQDATGGEVVSTTQRDKLLEHILANYGVALPDMKKATLQRRMNDPDLPQAVRDLVAIRLQQSASSTSKYSSVIKATNKDGRCRGTIQFGGAQRTLRAAGRTFQPHNLPSRGLVPAEELEDGIQAMKDGVAHLMFDNVMHLASSAIRGLVVAPPGKKLLISDLSNIEGRVSAWVAGESWKLKAFKEFDAGLGPDMYKLAYVKSFGVNTSEVDKPKRDIGKVMELMLGYGGGVGAYVTGAATYNFDIEEMAANAWDSLPKHVVEKSTEFYEWSIEKNMPGFGLTEKAYVTCDVFKRLWREANPNIVSYWHQLHSTIVGAIRNPGVTVKAGLLRVRRDGAWLRIQLPSGRYLCYPGIDVNDEDEVSYMGINQYTRKWSRIKSWYGKFFENVSQSISRDVLYNPMAWVEDQGYKIILHVHDELVTEAPDTDEYTIEELNTMLATNPEWAEGLPLSAAGFETYRYRKG